jgi:hypothetical protein
LGDGIFEVLFLDGQVNDGHESFLFGFAQSFQSSHFFQ